MKSIVALISKKNYIKNHSKYQNGLRFYCHLTLSQEGLFRLDQRSNSSRALFKNERVLSAPSYLPAYSSRQQHPSNCSQSEFNSIIFTDLVPPGENINYVEIRRKLRMTHKFLVFWVPRQCRTVTQMDRKGVRK